MSAEELEELITSIQQAAKTPLRSIKLDWKPFQTSPMSTPLIKPTIEIIYENGNKTEINDESIEEGEEGFGAYLGGP